MATSPRPTPSAPDFEAATERAREANDRLAGSRPQGHERVPRRRREVRLQLHPVRAQARRAVASVDAVASLLEHPRRADRGDDQGERFRGARADHRLAYGLQCPRIARTLHHSEARAPRARAARDRPLTDEREPALGPRRHRRLSFAAGAPRRRRTPRRPRSTPAAGGPSACGSSRIAWTTFDGPSFSRGTPA